MRVCLKLPLSLRLCVMCGINILSARNRCPGFDKVKYLESKFGGVGQASNQSSDMQDCKLLQGQKHLLKTYC